MKRLILIVILIFLVAGCSAPDESKYEISNDSTMVILDSDYELLYEKAKNAAFAYIDTINEGEYLPIDESKLMVSEDRSAVFILKIADKPDIEDDSVMVAFSYLEDEKTWQRLYILYNQTEYGK